MKFQLDIRCENAAFGHTYDSMKEETCNILREAIQKINNHRTEASLLDSNGNVVGGFQFKNTRAKKEG